MTVDIIIICLVNIVMWSIVFHRFTQSKQVEVIVKRKNNYLLTIVFMLLGILMYLKNPSYYMILNFISFSCAGFILSNLKEGFTAKGILFFGRLHPYNKIHDYQLEKKWDGYHFNFQVKQRNYYLILEEITKQQIDQYLNKLGGKYD